LFCLLRDRILIVGSSAASCPLTESNAPRRASSVRFSAYLASAEFFVSALVPFALVISDCARTPSTRRSPEHRENTSAKTVTRETKEDFLLFFIESLFRLRVDF